MVYCDKNWEKIIFSIVIKEKKKSQHLKIISFSKENVRTNGTNSPYFAKRIFKVFQCFTPVVKNTPK